MKTRRQPTLFRLQFPSEHWQNLRVSEDINKRLMEKRKRKQHLTLKIKKLTHFWSLFLFSLIFFVFICFVFECQNRATQNQYTESNCASLVYGGCRSHMTSEAGGPVRCGATLLAAVKRPLMHSSDFPLSPVRNSFLYIWYFTKSFQIFYKYVRYLTEK